MSQKISTVTTEEALQLGIQHLDAGQLQEAENIFQQILNKYPNQPVALHMMGLIAHQVGKNDAAVDFMTRSIEVKPDYTEAYNNMGAALQLLGRSEQAIASYNKALALSPNFRTIGPITNDIRSYKNIPLIFLGFPSLKAGREAKRVGEGEGERREGRAGGNLRPSNPPKVVEKTSMTRIS